MRSCTGVLDGVAVKCAGDPDHLAEIGQFSLEVQGWLSFSLGITFIVLLCNRALPSDATEQGEVDKAASTAGDTFGSVDILVDNSGVTWEAPPTEIPPGIGLGLVSSSAHRLPFRNYSANPIINVRRAAGGVVHNTTSRATG
jgi:hypothetical protein